MTESPKIAKRPETKPQRKRGSKKAKDVTFFRKATISKEEMQLYRKYKTSLCRHFEETKECELGPLCSFAHGRQELRGYNDVSPFVKFESLWLAAST